MWGLGKLRAAGDRLFNAAVYLTVHTEFTKPQHAAPMAAIAGCCCAVAMLRRNAKRQTGRSDHQSSKAEKSTQPASTTTSTRHDCANVNLPAKSTSSKTSDGASGSASSSSNSSASTSSNSSASTSKLTSPIVTSHPIDTSDLEQDEPTTTALAIVPATSTSPEDLAANSTSTDLALVPSTANSTNVRIIGHHSNLPAATANSLANWFPTDSPANAPRRPFVPKLQLSHVTVKQPPTDQEQFNTYDSLEDDTAELAAMRSHSSAMGALTDITNGEQWVPQPEAGMQGLLDRQLQMRHTSSQLVKNGYKAVGLGQENGTVEPELQDHLEFS